MINQLKFHFRSEKSKKKLCQPETVFGWHSDNDQNQPEIQYIYIYISIYCQVFLMIKQP